MRNRRSLHLLLLVFSLAAALPSAIAQVVIATIPVGNNPHSGAVNSVTNKVYVGNNCGVDPTCQSGSGTMTVIDGATLSTQTVAVGDYPYSVAVNAVTNKASVATCGNDPTCASNGTVAIIDGVTLSTQNVNVGINPVFVAVNSVTNKIYAVNLSCSAFPCSSPGTVTAIDGATLGTQTVIVGYDPHSLAIDSVTNNIYVINECGEDVSCGSHGTVTVIDGVTLATQTVNVGFVPLFSAVNSVTDKIYVVNNGGSDGSGNGTVTVIDGSTLSTQTVAVGIFPAPVAVNTTTNRVYVGNRCGSDPNCYNDPSATVIDGNTLSTTTVSICSIETYPDDVEVNSVTNHIYLPCSGRRRQGTTGRIVTDIDGATNNTTTPIAVGDFPAAALVNSVINTIYVPNAGDGTVSVIAGDTALQFVNVPPCRVVDTRNANGTFGGPAIQGGTFRSFPIPQGACNIPATAAAYSLNVTLVPDQGTPVGYLTIWPAGENQPVASTTNSLDGRVKANAGIIPAGVTGGVSVFEATG